MSEQPLHLSRRKALAAIGAGGFLLASRSVSQAEPPDNDSPPAAVIRVPTVADMRARTDLQTGGWVETMGFYTPGDGGTAIYHIQKLDNDVPPNGADVIELANGLVAGLASKEPVNYQMFGARSDGESDDGVQIKLAHEYAVRHDLPVINLSGEFWIKQTNNIPITTNVYWGKSAFHIDERFNDRSYPRFVVQNDEPQETVEWDDATKKAVLEKLKPGVQIISELAPYAGYLISVVDSNDRIGLRAGASFAGQGWSREELFYVEEEGRIIGDIAWEFKDFTSVTAIPCNRNYLVIEGGGFLYSGDNPQGTRYHHNGILIQRSRTIIRQQWMGLEPGKRDVSMEPRRGHYVLTRVYDVTIEDVRAMPWERDRADEDRRTRSGTYGIGGARWLYCTFRNLTAEAGWVAWGIFGTNINKNLRLENCRINRVDVHFHCWNLYISNCTIGFRGIAVTGGGELVVENSTRHGNFFINFRRDYGAKWDGHVRLRNCRLHPNRNRDACIFYHRMADFDYQYPIGFARSVQVENVVVDYSALPDSTNNCWLMDIVPFSRTEDGTRLFFPYQAEFRNITVEGRERGVRLMKIPRPHHYDVQRPGAYDGNRLRANSTLVFDRIQLEKLTPKNKSDVDQVHFLLGGLEEHDYEDDRALYPKIHFKNCENLCFFIGNSVAYIDIEDCGVNLVNTVGLKGGLSLSDCHLQAQVQEDEEDLWAVASTLGTRFTNCMIHSPVIDGDAAPEMVDRLGFIKINGTVRHYHLNTSLSNDVLAHSQAAGVSLTKEFVAKLKAHHALEE